MKLSVSTTNLYMLPFPTVLDIYRQAGFEFVELAGYWQGGDWEIAQHLKGIPPKDVIQMVRDSGLKIATFHDMGGLVGEKRNSIISPQTFTYLEYETIPCVVFHTPHKRNADFDWWRSYQSRVTSDIRSLPQDVVTCIENLPPIPGFYVPLVDPGEMRAFLMDKNIYANVDTTHYAQSGIDILDAADTLGELIKTVHLSDYNSKPHSPIGSGTLDLTNFIKKLDLSTVHAITVESELIAPDERGVIENAKAARAKVLEMI